MPPYCFAYSLFIYFYLGEIHIKLTISKGKIHWHLVHSLYCKNHYPYLVLKHFFHPQIKYPVPIKQLLTIRSSSLSLATTNLLSASMDLPTLDISCKWNHTICGLLCLVSST